MIKTTKPCPMCAEEIPADAAVCPYCGTPLVESAGQPAPPPAPPIAQAWTAPPQPPARKSRAWIWWLVGGGALVLLCIGAVIVLLLAGKDILALAAPATPTLTPRPTATSTLAPTALPAQEINLWCPDSPTYTVSVGQPVIFRWGWGTASEAYAQDYINAASFSVYVDGDQLDISRATSGPYSCEWNFCMEWRLPPFYLEEGTHSVYMTITLDREITDGYDLDQDGKLDTYGPGINTRPSCIIIVR
jgi:hypothetical protein